jgi:hypothetical protein
MPGIRKLLKLKRKRKPRWMRTELDRIKQKQVWVFRFGVAILTIQIILIVWAIMIGENIPWLWVILWGGW